MSKTPELIEYLVGTCNTLDTGLNTIGVLEDDVDFELLDAEIFLCETCGWWCHIFEQLPLNTCDECFDENLE